MSGGERSEPGEGIPCALAARPGGSIVAGALPATSGSVEYAPAFAAFGQTAVLSHPARKREGAGAVFLPLLARPVGLGHGCGRFGGVIAAADRICSGESIRR